MAGVATPLWLVVLVVGTLCPTSQAKRLLGTCDFEDGQDLCGLEGKHYFRVAEGRPASDMAAMTSGYSGNGYLLLEDYNTENVIETPTLMRGVGTLEVHFAYYLNGRGEGSSHLKMLLQVDQSEAVVIWEAQLHDKRWHDVSLPLDVPEGASFKVKWAGTAHRNTWVGQVTYLGLDYIEVMDYGAPVTCYRPPPVQYADPWACSALQAAYYSRPSPREELAEGTVCETSCLAGFLAQGQPKMTCQNGEWHEASDVVFICIDTQGPQFTCPEDLELVTPYGWGSLWYTINQPQVADNSGSWDLLMYLNDEVVTETTTALGPGLHTVQFMATDVFMNQNSCNYTINVRLSDQTPPVAVDCPKSQTVESDRPILVAWQEPVFRDDTGYIDRVESNYEAGSVLGWGYHEVKYTAYDNSSNSASCSFGVTVTGLACHPLELPVFGALVCHDAYAGGFCVSMCGPDGDFTVPSVDLHVPNDYLCSTSGSWYPYEFTYDCLDSYGATTIMTSDHYYHGQCNETDTQLAMKQQALTIFNVADTDITLGQELQPEDFYVWCGPYIPEKR